MRHAIKKHNSARRGTLAKKVAKLYLVPIAVKKHPTLSAGIVTLGLASGLGLIWYNMKK